MEVHRNDITTDGVMRWRPSKRDAETTLLNACCESQLILIKYNLEKISKELAATLSTEKLGDFLRGKHKETLMWHNIMCCFSRVDRENVPPNQTKSCHELRDLAIEISYKIGTRLETLKLEERDRICAVNATEIDFVIHRKDGTSEKQKISILDGASIFEEMTTWVEFNKWGPLSLRGVGMNMCLHEQLDCTPEREKQYIDGCIRKIIHDHRLKGVLLYFEMRENLLERAPDEKIELQEVELNLDPCDGDDRDVRPYGASILIPIQTLLSSNSMFDAIRRHLGNDDWALVILTDGKDYSKHEVALYDINDDDFEMKHSIEEQKYDFDRKFIAGIQKMRKDVGAGIRIELLKISSFPINVVVYDKNGHKRTEKISLRHSIFDQLTKCVEFNKWESVILCGDDGDVYEKFQVYEIASKAVFEEDMFSSHSKVMYRSLFNVEMKQHISNIFRKYRGGLLHFEILESAPDIENQHIEQTVMEPDQTPKQMFSQAPGNMLTARLQSVTWV
jgi:hypothetical protein